MWIHCLPDFPHHPFPWAPRAAIPWNASTAASLITTVVGPGITNGDQPHRGNSEGCLNQSEACSNPVIKILHWMLILWKKPNDFTACLISEPDEKPKPIQQNESTVHNMGCLKKSVSMWGSSRRKKWSVVLQSTSLELDLCLEEQSSVWKLCRKRLWLRKKQKFG